MKVDTRINGGNYYLRVQIHGKEIFQSLKTKNRSLAEDRAKAIVAKARNKQFDAVKAVQNRNGSPTCEKVLELYKILAKERGLKPVSIRETSSRFKRIAGVEGEWSNVRLHELTRNTILKFVDSTRLEDPDPERLVRWKRTTKSTINQARAVFAKWAIEEYKARGLNIPNLEGFMRAEGVNNKGIAKQYVRPPEDQVELILNTCSNFKTEQPELYTVFLLTYSIAMRAEEASNARLSWLEQRDGHWTMRIPVDSFYGPKGGKWRFVPVHDLVAEDLMMSGEKTGTGYFQEGSSPTARYNLVTKVFSKKLHAAGWKRLKVAQELRALQGCRWFTEQSAEIAQTLLGHKSIATTCQFYALYSKRPEPLKPDWI